MARGPKSAAVEGATSGGKWSGNGATLGFEQRLWAAADTIRGNLDPAEYKHAALGLIFLKYISDAFQERYAALLTDPDAPGGPRRVSGRECLLGAPGGRWLHLQANARQPTIGQLVDGAMEAIERENPLLKEVLPKEYTRSALNGAAIWGDSQAAVERHEAV